MTDISWSYWIFCAHKLVDQDVSTLAKLDFGGPANFDFDTQSFGTDARGQRWYGRQHNKNAGRLYLQLSSLDDAEAALGPQRVKQVTDHLPRRCRGVMHMDYICREELDGVVIDDQMDFADQEYFYDLGLQIASFVHLNWRWPSTVGFYRPSDDRFDVVVPQDSDHLAVIDEWIKATGRQPHRDLGRVSDVRGKTHRSLGAATSLDRPEAELHRLASRHRPRGHQPHGS